MKYIFLLSFVILTCSINVSAQKKANTAFAIVSGDNSNISWMNIEEVDLSSGEVTRTIFDKDHTNFQLVDAATRSSIKSDKAEWPGTKLAWYQHPTASLAAAAAYDAGSGKLFFTPMRFAELRWINLNEKGSQLKVYCLTDQPFYKDELKNEAQHITRMVIAGDGNGYALSNDGNELFRFTTGKKTVVTRLGQVKDDSRNSSSFHDRSNWGGDMVADAAGNLYVISAAHAVFAVNIHSQTAIYKGIIDGLPSTFTTNGAAIDNDGNLVVSSANSREGYYKVDLATLTSEKQATSFPLQSYSDLATNNLAFQKQGQETARLLTNNPAQSFAARITVFPNPVTTGTFKVSFDNAASGVYHIQLTDLTGRIFSDKQVSISSANQVEAVLVNAALAKGVYLLNVKNASNKLVSSGKVLLQ